MFIGYISLSLKSRTISRSLAPPYGNILYEQECTYSAVQDTSTRLRNVAPAVAREQVETKHFTFHP